MNRTTRLNEGNRKNKSRKIKLPPISVISIISDNPCMDFSKVRIHTGENANKAAEEMNARAFTLGNDIVFARGEYNPASAEGKSLMAHELTHVVQQDGGEQTVQREEKDKKDYKKTLQDLEKFRKVSYIDMLEAFRDNIFQKRNVIYLSEIAKDHPLVFYSIRKAIGFAIDLDLVNTRGLWEISQKLDAIRKNYYFSHKPCKYKFGEGVDITVDDISFLIEFGKENKVSCTDEKIYRQLAEMQVADIYYDFNFRQYILTKFKDETLKDSKMLLCEIFNKYPLVILAIQVACNSAIFQYKEQEIISYIRESYNIMRNDIKSKDILPNISRTEMEIIILRDQKHQKDMEKMGAFGKKLKEFDYFAMEHSLGDIVLSAALIYAAHQQSQIKSMQDNARTEEFNKAVQEKMNEETIKEIKSNTNPLDELAALREKMLLPKAGTEAGDDYTLAKLEIGGRSFYGRNGWGGSRKVYDEYPIKSNSITRSHAEGDVFLQAYKAGLSGGKARLIVDQELCDACGQNGGVKTIAKELGITELEIITPSGTKTINP